MRLGHAEKDYVASDVLECILKHAIGDERIPCAGVRAHTDGLIMGFKMHTRDRGINGFLFALWLSAGGFAFAQHPVPAITAVVNAAGMNYLPDPITAGSIISITGTNLATS